jgi:hypothetical protein
LIYRKDLDADLEPPQGQRWKAKEAAMLFTPTADHQDGFISLLVQRWHAWKERRDGLAALNRCGRGEMARMAHDLSLSSEELRALAGKGPASADLLYRRMGELRLDRETIHCGEPDTLRDMQKTCSLCASKRRCRRDLARGADASAWHPYCPNDDALAALVAGGAHCIRGGSSSALSGAIADDEQGSRLPWVLGVLLVILAWLVLLAAPPGHRQSSLRRLAPIAAPEVIASPLTTLGCLDTTCLTAQQQLALRDLRIMQAHGWIASSADQIASLPRIASLAQGVQAGEALACSRADGTTTYGFMFQSGCSTGGTEAAKLEGFQECRPMAAGGACLTK